MRKLAIALLATTFIGAPAFAASNAPQQPNAKQMQPQSNNQQSQNQPNKGQQSAQNTNGDQPISARNLPRKEVRQIQQALDKDGFKVGRVDGRFGPETRNAVKQFQQSKQIQANGQLNQQTLADLGLNTDTRQTTGSAK